MKKHIVKFLFLFVLASFIVIDGYSQNYRIFDPVSPFTYHSTTPISIPPGFNYFTYSDVRVTKIDSVVNQSGDVLLFPFHTWQDTAAPFGCNEFNGNSWMGHCIIEKPNGMTIGLTQYGDSIYINTAATIGQSWRMFTDSVGNYLEATVDSIFYFSFISISDSVKQIHINSFTSQNALDTLSDFNNKVIWLSKNNGMIKGFAFRDVPNYFELNRIDPVNMPTTADVYDYAVGDEFEYISQCSPVFGLGSPPVFSYNKILQKWFSPLNDTVYYLMNVKSRSYVWTGGNPPYNTVYTDTTLVNAIPVNSNIPFYSEVPEENSPTRLGIYLIKQNTNDYNGRFVFEEVTGFYDVFSVNCVQFNSFEPVFYTQRFSPGLGFVYNGRDERSIGSQLCEQRLFWYHKGNEFWGTFDDLTGIEDVALNQKIKLFPNPAGNSFFIQLPNTIYNVEILSINGSKIFDQQSINDNLLIDCSQWPKGIYIARIQTKDAVGTRMIVVN